MSIDFDMRLEFRMLDAALEAIIPIALARAAEIVRADALDRTPNRHGAAGLAGSSGVTVVGAGRAATALIKYHGPYAAYQQRGMRADGTHVIRNRPAGGETGFLSTAMVAKQAAALDIVADTIRQHL